MKMRALLLLIVVLIVACGERSTVARTPAEDLSFGRRFALVIGNGDYKVSQRSPYFGPLLNPEADAQLIADTLSSETIGFRVTLRLNRNFEEMESDIRDFVELVEREVKEAKESGRPQPIALVWFAGHGAQSGGENFLIPVDEIFQRQADLERNAIKMSWLLDSMPLLGATKIIILDACRDNNLPAEIRGSSRGLAPINRAPPNTKIYFSTAANDTAADDSKFASAFAREILTPGTIDALFIRVRTSVYQPDDNGRGQLPWDGGSLLGEFSFIPKIGNDVVYSLSSLLNLRIGQSRHFVRAKLGAPEVESSYSEFISDDTEVKWSAWRYRGGDGRRTLLLFQDDILSSIRIDLCAECKDVSVEISRFFDDRKFFSHALEAPTINLKEVSLSEVFGSYLDDLTDDTNLKCRYAYNVGGSSASTHFMFIEVYNDFSFALNWLSGYEEFSLMVGTRGEIEPPPGLRRGPTFYVDDMDEDMQEQLLTDCLDAIRSDWLLSPSDQGYVQFGKPLKTDFRFDRFWDFE